MLETSLRCRRAWGSRGSRAQHRGLSPYQAPSCSATLGRWLGLAAHARPCLRSQVRHRAALPLAAAVSVDIISLTWMKCILTLSPHTFFSLRLEVTPMLFPFLCRLWGLP